MFRSLVSFGFNFSLQKLLKPWWQGSSLFSDT